MRRIIKSNEPVLFAEWKALANDDWKPDFGCLQNPEKETVYKSLLAEQGHICCYCERELVAGDYHIEHLNPQFKKECDDLNYSNLICSCLNKTSKGAPLHCGTLKGDCEIEVHPLQEDCESKFEYRVTGEIIGLDDAAKNTIEVLGLSIRKLVDMRVNAIEPFLSEDIDDAEFTEFVIGYLTLNHEGKFNPFYSAISYIFGDLVKQE